jgi:hypothetical protein
VALTWDGSRFILYLDGIAVHQEPAPTFAWGDGPLTIGTDRDMGANDDPFWGSLDELRIYNRVLSEAEILGLARP